MSHSTSSALARMVELAMKWQERDTWEQAFESAKSYQATIKRTEKYHYKLRIADEPESWLDSIDRSNTNYAKLFSCKCDTLKAEVESHSLSPEGHEQASMGLEVFLRAESEIVDRFLKDREGQNVYLPTERGREVVSAPRVAKWRDDGKWEFVPFPPDEAERRMRESEQWTRDKEDSDARSEFQGLKDYGSILLAKREFMELKHRAREHVPAVLKYVPDVDFFGDTPIDAVRHRENLKLLESDVRVVMAGRTRAVATLGGALDLKEGEALTVDDRLVTAMDVAQFLKIERTSLQCSFWPVPDETHKGSRPAKWRRSRLVAFLQGVYPRKEWSRFPL